MSIRTDQVTPGPSAGVTRQELLTAAGEVAALFVIFIIAFTGRDAFSDGVKTFLTILSVIVGAVGAGAGLAIIRRAAQSTAGRYARVALGGFMVFIGVYTIFHVLS